jgi:hypothetical protein
MWCGQLGGGCNIGMIIVREKLKKLRDKHALLLLQSVQTDCGVHAAVFSLGIVDFLFGVE